MNTPILLITFNRPNHTRQVLSAILSSEVKELYVFQDGMREDNVADKEKCQKVCEVIQELTTSANVNLHTFYSDKNLGCGPGPAAAISWFFENVEQGIIIEDDAIPSTDFFPYAGELLDKYKDDKDVRAIASMKILKKSYGSGSYYFSMMNRNLCAWATWKRAWQDFDYTLSGITRKRLNSTLKSYRATYLEREYWCDLLKPLQKDGMNCSSWDIQFLMSIWLHRGKGICPNNNLSSNIGFSEGTHTDENNVASNLPVEQIMPLIHPLNMDIERRADLSYHKTFFQPYEYGISGVKRLPYRINKRIKRLFNHQGPWFKKR